MQINACMYVCLCVCVCGCVCVHTCMELLTFKKYIQSWSIIFIIHQVHFNSFSLILFLQTKANNHIRLSPSIYLFPGKHILVEVKLKLFISNVDAELFKRVILAVLKPEDVKHSNIM